MDMKNEECDICGRKCDGVHSNKLISKEKEIKKKEIKCIISNKRFKHLKDLNLF